MLAPLFSRLTGIRVIHEVSGEDDVVNKLRTQKGVTIDYEVIDKASHFWTEHLPSVEKSVSDYLDKRLAENPI